MRPWVWKLKFYCIVLHVPYSAFSLDNSCNVLFVTVQLIFLVANMNQDKRRFDSSFRKYKSAVLWERLPQTILDKCRSRYIFVKWHNCLLNVKDFWIREQWWPRTDSKNDMVYLDLHWSQMRLGWFSWNTAVIFHFSQTKL